MLSLSVAIILTVYGILLTSSWYIALLVITNAYYVTCASTSFLVKVCYRKNDIVL
jgi:hypothetical protein